MTRVSFLSRSPQIALHEKSEAPYNLKVNRYWLLFFLFCFSASASSPQTLFQHSVRLYQKQNYKAAEKILTKLVSKYPKKALYWFNLGNVQYMMKDFSGAEFCFGKVESLGSPLAPAATYYRSKAIHEMGQTERAKALLISLLKSTTLPPGLRKAAISDLTDFQMDGSDNDQHQKILELYRAGKYRAALIAMRGTNDPELLSLKALILIKLNREELAYNYIKQLQSRGGGEAIDEVTDTLLERVREAYSKPKWLYLEMSGGHDSNLSRSLAPSPGPKIMVDLGAGGRIWSNDELYMVNMGYIGQLKEALQNKDFRALSNELFIGVGRELGPELFMLTPFVKTEAWADKTIYQSSGSRLIIRSGSDGSEYGLSANVSWDNAVSQGYDYLEGTSLQTKLFWGSISYPYHAQAYVYFEKQAVGDREVLSGETIPMSYSGYGLGTRVVARMKWHWMLEGIVAYIGRNYQGKTSVSNQSRQDKNLNVALTLSRRFHKNLFLYTTMTADTNQSTLNLKDDTDQNYKAWQWFIGGVWEVF